MKDISIIVPARNAARTITPTLRSLVSQKHVQEIILIDDGSTDGTSEMARRLNDPRIAVLPSTGRGIADALNTGFDAARGQYIARCDADDLYPVDRLQWQRAWLMDNPDYIAVSGGYKTITASGRAIIDLACEGDSRDVTEELLHGRSVTSLCSWLVFRDAIKATGGARSWFVTGEDLDLQYRIAEQGKVWHRPVVSYLYRLHDASIVHSKSRAFNKFYESHARKFALQRRAGGQDDLTSGNPPEFSPEDSVKGLEHRNTVAVQASGQLQGRAWRHFENGKSGEALRLMLQAVSYTPLSVKKWRGLLAMLWKLVRDKLSAKSRSR